MARTQVIIDGNNLLFAVQALAPQPALGRETLVRRVERWSETQSAAVTLVFDGPPPRRPLARQLASRKITVRFAAPRTADDLIIEHVHATTDPGSIRVITTDTAIRHEAAYRRCRVTRSEAFVSELFAPTPRSTDAHQQIANSARPSDQADAPGKPELDSPEDVDRWLERMGADDTDFGIELDPFDFDV